MVDFSRDASLLEKFGQAHGAAEGYRGISSVGDGLTNAESIGHSRRIHHRV